MGKRKDLEREVKALTRKLGRQGRALTVAAKPKAAHKPPPKISDSVLALSKVTEQRIHDLSTRIFEAAKPMPGVIPTGQELSNNKQLKIACDAAATAMDQQIIFAGGWSGTFGFGQYGAFAEGQAFLGYPYLAELTQRPEYRVISEIVATEMFRKGIEFKTSETGARVVVKPQPVKPPLVGRVPPAAPALPPPNKDAKLKELEDEFKRLRVLESLQEIAEQDGFFGRSHLFLDFDDSADKPDELLSPVGDGQNLVTQEKVQKGSLKRIKCVEAIWCYPTGYNSNNPLRADWYKPQEWFAMGKRIHASRFLTFIGREVPDLLKPAYSFGGLSMSQMAKPYVDNWLRTRQSVSDITHSFTVWNMQTNLAETLTQSGDELFRRMALFSNLRDNKGVLLTDKDTELMENISAPLGTLDKLQAQAAEQMCMVARTPKVRLLGLDPAGLNASSEGELEVFDDYVIAYRKKFVEPNLDRIFRFAQINIWGAVDPDISYGWPALDELSEKEKAEVRKIDADTDVVYLDAGAIDSQEIRARIAKDKDSPYSNLDPDKVVVPPVEEGGFGGEPGGEPNQGGGLGGNKSPFMKAV